jgi:hypothetical protein
MRPNPKAAPVHGQYFGIGSPYMYRSIRDNYMPFGPVLKIKGTYK